MNYKVKKEHRKEFANKVYILRVGDILEYCTGTYIFKTFQQWIEYPPIEIENNPEYFEPIEDKMTWEKLEAKFKGLRFIDAKHFFKIFKEHCILKDELIAVGGLDIAKNIAHDYFYVKDGKYYETYVKEMK